MGSAEGARKARAYQIEQYGSVERYREVMRKKASNAGKKTSGYEFAHGRIDPTETINKRWIEVERQRRIGGKEE